MSERKHGPIARIVRLVALLSRLVPLAALPGNVVFDMLLLARLSSAAASVARSDLPIAHSHDVDALNNMSPESTVSAVRRENEHNRDPQEARRGDAHRPPDLQQRNRVGTVNSTKEHIHKHQYTQPSSSQISSGTRSVEETNNNGDDNRATIDANPRIINGNNAVRGRYPYMISLQYLEDAFCGATLIAPDVVLTAAHCVPPEWPVSSISVVVDPHNINNPDSQSEVLSIDSAIIHPSYEVDALSNDIAILKLQSPAQRHDPITLNANPDVPTDGQTPITVIGWGDRSAGFSVSASVLQEYDGGIYITNNECQSRTDFNFANTNGFIEDNNLCLQPSPGNYGSVCYGDSGGPAMIKGDDPTQDIQVGVTSWILARCTGTNIPAVFARVSWFYSFIQEQVCQLSNDPPASFDCTGSAMPSGIPSSTPSSNPTLIPTAKFTSRPTMMPTVQGTGTESSGSELDSPPNFEEDIAEDTAAPSATIVLTSGRQNESSSSAAICTSIEASITVVTLCVPTAVLLLAA